LQVEHRILTKASPSTIYAIYTDVAAWPTWDPDTAEASLNGPFAVGAQGKLKPTKGNTVPMLLTDVQLHKLFTVESKIPGFKMVFEHELKLRGEQTEIVHRITLSGFLKFLIGKMLVKQINAGMPTTLLNLKALAEKNESRHSI
jgi:hypothetical protein